MKIPKNNRYANETPKRMIERTPLFFKYSKKEMSIPSFFAIPNAMTFVGEPIVVRFPPRLAPDGSIAYTYRFGRLAMPVKSRRSDQQPNYFTLIRSHSVVFFHRYFFDLSIRDLISFMLVFLLGAHSEAKGCLPLSSL